MSSSDLRSGKSLTDIFFDSVAELPLLSRLEIAKHMVCARLSDAGAERDPALQLTFRLLDDAIEELKLPGQRTVLSPEPR